MQGTQARWAYRLFGCILIGRIDATDGGWTSKLGSRKFGPILMSFEDVPGFGFFVGKRLYVAFLASATLLLSDD